AALAAATERQGAELSRFVQRARAALTGAGFSDSPEMVARISKTLLGAALGRPRDLRAGRLTEELALPGFEVLTGVPPELARRPDEAATPRPPRGESPADRHEREQRERATEALRVAGAEAEGEEWQRGAGELERAAGQRREALARADAGVSDLRARLHDAEARATEARRALEQVDREAERARREAERARARREAAEKALPARRDRS